MFNFREESIETSNESNLMLLLKDVENIEEIY
jgi:hypothetical protein